ncbi:hypothetical protein OG607_01320 [Streptomyces sp. NBC_01537]|uniref:hypothetical protein n=1 Tax=Streptomyces sp. NBC_01537 TaxID=2903896 RepID=UPI0038699C6D
MSMTKNIRISVATALAVGLLPVLAACGGSSGKSGSDASTSATTGGANAANSSTKNADGAVQLNIPDGTNDETKKLYIMENGIAACMKKQGFSYTPHVGTGTPDAVNALDGADYALAKKYRQKYGFGTYAAAVYPSDPEAPGGSAGGRMRGKTLTPTDDDEKGFTAAQLKAYDLALNGPPAKTKAEEKEGGCTAVGRAAAYGPALSQEAEKKAWNARVQTNKDNGLVLNGDVQLVQLAQSYANCLRAGGIQVTSTQPTGMVDMVRLDLSEKLPEQHNWTKEAALPLLTKDIQISLKDLECGKKFRAAYFPKLKAHPYWGDSA